MSLQKVLLKKSRKSWSGYTPLEIKYYQYADSAKIRGLEFDLSPREFESFSGRRCVYCGNKISIIGIDRLDSSIGYVIENCVPCCGKCNMMKGRLKIWEFLDQCARITHLNENREK